MLTRAGAALVAAASREEIHDVAVDAARSLAGEAAAALPAASARTSASRRCAAAAGDRTRRARALPAPPDGGRTIVRVDAPRAVGAPDERASPSAPGRAASRALIVVAGEAPRLRAALRALATQVALALDSAALTEEMHRRRAKRASARSCSTRAISSPCSIPTARSATRARRSSACSATRPSEVVGHALRRPVEAGDRGRLARSSPPRSPATPSAAGDRMLARAPRRHDAPVRDPQPTCSTTSTSAASCSTAATSASARSSRGSSPIRPSTTL